jgi:hypothetical protein
MTKPFKPTFPQLALLDWLYERKGCRFLVTSNMGSRSGDFDMFETDGRNEENGKLRLKRYSGFGSEPESVELTRRLGGSRMKVDLSPLVQERILKSGNSLYARAGTMNFKSFADQLDVDENYFHYSSSVYLLTKEVGYCYWEETGKALFEQMKTKRAADRAKAERLVLVGRISPIEPVFPAALIKKLPQGLRFPIPDRKGLRPQAYATVVKETDKRLYLEDIQYVREMEEYGSKDPRVIQGYKDKFVEREHVIIDYATPEIIRKLTAIDAEYQEDVTRIAVDFAEKMLPIMQEMDQRFFQKDNEREMVFKEAVEDFKSADKPQEVAKPSARRR